jgi:hypothetical protein
MPGWASRFDADENESVTPGFVERGHGQTLCIRVKIANASDGTRTAWADAAAKND